MTDDLDKNPHYHALKEHNARWARALYLRHQGLLLREIGEDLGIGVPRVRWLINKAVRYMHEREKELNT